VDTTARLHLPDGASVAGRVQNIGEGGAFFQTDDLESPVAEGDLVTVLIGDPAADPLSIEGEVLRMDTEFHGGTVVRSLAIRFSTALPRGKFPFEGPPGSP
jgi:hypothetical protein